MDKMKQLARDVRSLEDQLAVCTRCGMCQANCPLFAQTRKESDVSRGKFALITGLIEQMFDDARGVDERLQRCLLCGSCAHGCPSNVNALEIFLKARVIIAQYLGLPFAKKIVFKKMLSRPEAFNGIIRLVAPFQTLFFREEKNLQGTSCARIASPLLRHRHLVALKQTAFNQTLADQDLKIDGKGIKVAIFVGCLIDKAFPNIAHSMVDVLTHFNAQVFIPAGQGCCGIPAIASGDFETFETLVRFHVDLFSKQRFDYLVTACATCSATIINLWPSLLKQADPHLLKKIQALSEKTVDISWLMEKRFDLSGAVSVNDTPKKSITYHDPCHLKKSLGVYEEPRKVIGASGYAIKEMKDPDTCCGMGGSFNLQHYDLSARIGRKKAQHIIETGCSMVATSCPACMMQISDMLAGQNRSIAVKHPVELYARALRAGNRVSDP